MSWQPTALHYVVFIIHGDFHVRNMEEAKKRVGARTGNSRIPMKITVSHFYHLTFPIIFNLAEFYLIIASFEFFKS